MTKRINRKTIVSILLFVTIVTTVLLIALSGTFTPEPRVEIRADNCYSETLKVVTDNDYLPYSFYDAEGNVSGHDVELIALIANELKMNLDIDFLPWTQGIQKVTSGKADILMTCDYVDSFEGSENLIKTEPVSSDDFVIFSRKKITDIDNLYDKKIAVMENGNVLSEINMMNLDSNCTVYGSNKEALTAVEMGKEDCAIMRYTIGEALLKELEIKDIDASFAISQSFMCFGVYEGNEELVDRINDAVDVLRVRGDLSRLHKKWLTTFVHTYSVGEVVSNNIWMVILPSILALGVLFLFLIFEQKKIRTAAKNSEAVLKKFAGDISSYIINTHTGEYKIISQNNYISGNYSNGEEYSVLFGKYIENDVYESDRGDLRELTDLSVLVSYLSDKDEYRIVFREISSGNPRWVELILVKYSENEILMAFNDINEKHIEHIMFDKSEEYSFAQFYVYLQSGMAYLIKDDPGFLFENEKMMPFDALLDRVADHITEEDRNFFIKHKDIEYINKKFEKDDKAIYIYNPLSFKEKTWVSLTQYVLERDEEGKPVVISMGFSFLDKDAASVQEMRSKLAEAYDTVREEQRRNEILHDTINSGRWSFFVNSEDEIIDGDVSEAANRIIKNDVAPDGYSWVNIVHPDDREAAEKAFYATIKDHTCNTPFDVQYRMIDRNGKYHWFHSVGRIYRDEAGNGEFYGIHIDITNQIEEQEKQNRQLEETLAIARRETKRNEIILHAFNASKWFYGINENDEVISAEYTDRIIRIMDIDNKMNPMEWINELHPDDKERVYEAFMAAIRDHSGNTPYDITFRMTNRDGNYQVVKSAGQLLRHDDGTAELIGMSLNLTPQMEKEKEQQRQLEDALNAADAASRAKTDFLFNMSHDIRTPMNAIIGFTNIAKREIKNTSKALDSLEKVKLSSDILLSLINDVLDMSRIESGKAELHEEKYEITEAFDIIAPAMESLAAAKDIDLSFDYGKVRDRFIFADGARFDRVLINIVSNAVKYTPAGGFVKVTAQQIEDTKPGYGNYKFSVTDSGIGMSEEFQKHMFEDFTREENSTTSGIQGTGLGLALAKKLVDMMGGTISCISKQGVGTTFTLIFPFRLQTEEDMAEERAEVEEKTTIDLSGKRALLVEDNELNREIAGDILDSEGIIVETAVDGQKAVNIIRERGSGYYDFVLMDIQMPVMNGYEATRAIHQLMPDFKTPIIALSANAFEDDRRKSIEAGMDDHVAKPINISELMKVLSRFV